MTSLEESAQRRALLGGFLRAHRERMAPADASARRRTPGLRREELAARAGISATWLAWMEQGREVNASPQALARLSAALDLTGAERAYLFELARRSDPAQPEEAAASGVPGSVRALVEAVDHPAYAIDRGWNVRCWNAAASDLFVGLFAEHPANLLTYTLLSPEAHALLPDWGDRAARIVAEFRADYLRGMADPATAALVEHLGRASPEFAQAWAAQDVAHREGGRREFRHPVHGGLAYRQWTYIPAERRDYKVVVLVPPSPALG
jgi:transcriptional regulator with XRE-family HTH domain